MTGASFGAPIRIGHNERQSDGRGSVSGLFAMRIGMCVGSDDGPDDRTSEKHAEIACHGIIIYIIEKHSEVNQSCKTELSWDQTILVI